MERQLQHLVRLVDDLLDTSRISQGKLQLQKSRITLSEIVAHALDISGQDAQQDDHQLTVTLPDEPIYVDADKTRLAQVICNLLSNAAKYSERGSRTWLTVERRAEQAVIRVEDTGIGIPPDMLHKVFEMFTQVDRSLEKAQGGLGIGLSIVKRLIEMHGGTVEARSEGCGKGSEFIVRLPIAMMETQEQSSPPAVEGGSAIKRRILVVDDNRDAAASLSMLLKLMSNEVCTAHDGLAAIDAADLFRPDVILLDIGMPKLNGFDTCRLLRERSSSKNAVIVAMTGWGQEEDKRQSKEAGFNCHLVKPVEPAALRSILSTLK